MKLIFVSILASLFLAGECGGQSHVSAKKAPVQESASQLVSPAEAAHVAVMKYMQALKISDLPEGKEMLATMAWLIRATGLNSYPQYTSTESLYSKLFATDREGISGYKELFLLQGLTKAGTNKTFKYLVVAFQDRQSGEWKILGGVDDADGDSGSFDFDSQASAFERWSKSEPSIGNYRNYAYWSFLAGHLENASIALDALRAELQTHPSPVVNQQFQELSKALTAVASK